MTETKSSDVARPVSPDPVDQAVRDLNDGIHYRSFQKIMDDVDNQRRTNPGGMKDYLAAVNNGIGELKLGVTIADSGRPDQLSIESENHMRGLNVRVDGKPLSYYKPELHEKPALASDLVADPRYTHIAPPGLSELEPGQSVIPTGPLPDFTLDGNNYSEKNGGKFAVQSRESTATQNADGSTTYNYKGKLDSSFTSDGYWGNTFLTVGNVGFSGNETISPDGRVLSRHVEYDPAKQKKSLMAWMYDEDPGVDRHQKRTLDVLQAPIVLVDDDPKNSNDLKTLDTKFNPKTSRYESTATYLNGRVMNYLDDTSGKSVALSSTDCGKYNYWGKVGEENEDRDANGFIVTAYKPAPDGADNAMYKRKSIEIKRDANEEIIEFTDAHGLTSKRVDGDNWIGPDGPYKADVFADNAGDIVEKTAEGSKISTPRGDYKWLDNKGVILREHYGIGTGQDFDTDITYKINADGMEVGYVDHRLVVDSDGNTSHSTYDVDKKPEYPRYGEMPIMTKNHDYCVPLEK